MQPRSDRPRRARALTAATLAGCGLLAAACSTNAAGHHGTSTLSSTSPWSARFTSVRLPPPVNTVVDAACATAKDCWAVGSTVGGAGAPNGAAVIATTNGGKTWASQTIPPTAAYLSGIACADQLRCVAVGQADQNGQGAVLATVTGGASWAPGTLPAGIADVTAVTCQANRWCLAVGQLGGNQVALVSTTAGATWSQAGSLPAGVSGVSGLSCTDGQHCWAAGQTAGAADHVAGAVLATADGGATWTALAIPTGTGFLNGVACITGRVDTGTSAPTTPVPPSSTGTTAAGAAGSSPTSTSGPASPSTTAPTPTTTPSGSASSGTAPTTSVPPAPPTTAPNTVPGVGCVVVGTTASGQADARTGHGLILTTDDGGATWASQTAPADAAELFGVSCTAADTCVAVGSTTATTPAAGVVVFTGKVGHPWPSATTTKEPQSLATIACATTGRCVAAGESVAAYLPTA